MRVVERRLIYLLMIVAVAVPLIGKFSRPPSRMVLAEQLFDLVQQLQVQSGEVALLWLDFGPGTIAENEPQSEVLLEHLFRRRIPVVLVSQYQLAEGVLASLPQRVAKRLELEHPDQQWRYGEAWVNAGFRPGGSAMMQNFAKAQDLSAYLGRDVYGVPLSQYPVFRSIGPLERVKLVAEVTGLVGTLDTVIQFLQKDGYRPTLVHGCTSITIPEAYIFVDSQQLKGLLEGVAGAAWYSQIMRAHYPGSDGSDLLVRNTALGAAQVVLMILIVAGNIVGFVRTWRGRHA